MGLQWTFPGLKNRAVSCIIKALAVANRCEQGCCRRVSGFETSYLKIILQEEKMKKHKMFAWLTVFCFLMTIITGYEKK